MRRKRRKRSRHSAFFYIIHHFRSTPTPLPLPQNLVHNSAIPNLIPPSTLSTLSTSYPQLTPYLSTAQYSYPNTLPHPNPQFSIKTQSHRPHLPLSPNTLPFPHPTQINQKNLIYPTQELIQSNTKNQHPIQSPNLPQTS